ncbi:MAG TPA: hypothetical protein V6C57_29105 [Coleofasciculaceae cyanobacterium]
MMHWKVGQQMRCDRPEQVLTGCLVAAVEANSVKIICPTASIVVVGQQCRLEEMGWKAEQTAQTSYVRQMPTGTADCN